MNAYKKWYYANIEKESGLTFDILF